jgi:hypothetical protein
MEQQDILLDQQEQSAQEPEVVNVSKIKSDIPIEYWEKAFIGKKMVKDLDAPEDPSV